MFKEILLLTIFFAGLIKLFLILIMLFSLSLFSGPEYLRTNRRPRTNRISLGVRG